MKELSTFFQCLAVFICFCLLEFPAVSSLTEKEILLQFKGNVTTDPFDCLDSWDPSGSPCQDYGGVFCNSAGNVVKIALWNTCLSGVISSALSGLNFLRVLTLFGNKFTGSIPLEFVQLTSLWKINISSNALSGSIPEFLGDLPNIRFLDLSKNHFIREISVALFKNCQKTRFISFSHNNLLGSIPLAIGSCFRLEGVDLSYNNLSGAFPSVRLHSISSFLTTLYRTYITMLSCRDLSRNSLQGSIPQNIYNMSYLFILDLHSNRFDHNIPKTLGNLSNLHFLDLSQNILSGPIPPTLGNLKNLTHFNVSFNSLSGPIPSIQSLTSFGQSAFAHNPSLCGYPLDVTCSAVGSGTTLAIREKNKLSPSAIVAIVAASLILTGICVISVINVKARTRKRGKLTILESTTLASNHSDLIFGKLVLFSKSLPSKYEDWEAVTKALLDKKCLIGAGSIGTVYKTSFSGGISIAVKNLESWGRIASQEVYEHEIGRLGNLQHSNILTVQGYYWSNSMKLIISDFYPNGNLYDNLHGLSYPGTSKNIGNPELNWSRRVQIALGTAKALSYLHHDCKPPVLHFNIKSKNIFLDHDYEPKLCDYGLEKFLLLFDNYGLTKVHNAVGYVAPELAQSQRVGDNKCDVYSFGVILLELVTRRKPVERGANEVFVLREHVRGLIEKGGASQCFDKSLRGVVENELIQDMKLGLICTNETALRRPSMVEVVQFIESIRNGLGS